MKIDEIYATDHEISQIGDSAIVAVTIYLKSIYIDHPLDGQYKMIRVWKLYNDGWKVIAGSSTQL